MIAVLFQLLPFFALIAIGMIAGVTGMFDSRAAQALTKFVFYFALSALLFRFAADLDLAELFDPVVLGAYLLASVTVYAVTMLVARARRLSLSETAVECQCAVIGNVGFLGLPMLTMLMGDAAAGPILQVLTVDLVVFASLIVVLLSVARQGAITPVVVVRVGRAVIGNPMILAILAGFVWAGLDLPLPAPLDDTLRLMGNAATPGALFAIGLSLAQKSAERLSVAAWLSFAKLVLHPAAVALCVLLLFEVDAFTARVMISAAALPVAGNVFILAQTYNAAPQRVSAAILVSTLVSLISLTGILALTL